VTTSNDTDSPMVAQYKAIKAQHPDALLFFRMGDFYELFFDDAVTAAPVLEVALTRRGRHQGEEIAMCGVPVHAVETYLQRAIRRGFKVAICEQLEDPAEARRRGGRPLVRRDVVRVVTPGTVTEDSLLEPRVTLWLAATVLRAGRAAVARVDLASGRLLVESAAVSELGEILTRIAPAELVVTESARADPVLRAVLEERSVAVSPVPDAWLAGSRHAGRLAERFGVATLDGFAAFEPLEVSSLAILLDYLDLTQRSATARIEPPVRLDRGQLMRIDPATRRSLEIVVAQDGRRESSLLGTIDRTATSAGARLLAERIAAPLLDRAAIERRLDRIDQLLADRPLLAELRETLAMAPDLERALSRLALGRGGPRDLAMIGRGLAIARRLGARLASAGVLADLIEPLDADRPLEECLAATLVESPPVQARDGGLVRDGVMPELDRARSLRDDARRHVLELERRYRERTGIATLKVRHNRVIGFHIEVSASHADKVPADFRRRQGMAGATRFITDELAELDAAIAQAGEDAIALEVARFESLRSAVLAAADRIVAAARALAEIDVAMALATVAAERRWSRPILTDDRRFRIVAGRHPVVEAALAAKGQTFVANDCDLGTGRRLWLLGGPNMAGKSTFLRQNALIALLAQCGSFVPADQAEIGVVDRLFSRVGASDDLAAGRSTFMVEMLETAAILNQASSRSLVVLDEIGRGTATWDGLSLAWAVLEHLHDRIGCRTLFATHYHELTALHGHLRDLACHAMRVKEWQGRVVFLHEVVAGAADRSYGLHVARLAGVPETVLRRAGQILRKLESSGMRQELPLFAALAEAEPTLPAPPSAVESALMSVDPDSLTPREAHELLYRLHALARGEDG
jgi:DNA mismatch repair protein MutS